MVGSIRLDRGCYIYLLFCFSFSFERFETGGIRSKLSDSYCQATERTSQRSEAVGEFRTISCRDRGIET